MTLEREEVASQGPWRARAQTAQQTGPNKGQACVEGLRGAPGRHRQPPGRRKPFHRPNWNPPHRTMTTPSLFCLESRF